MNKIVSIISCSIVLLHAPICLAMEAQDLRQAHLYTIAKLITPALKDELAREQLFYLYPELQNIIAALKQPSATSKDISACRQDMSIALSKTFSKISVPNLMGLSPEQKHLFGYMQEHYPKYADFMYKQLPAEYAYLTRDFFARLKNKFEKSFKSLEAIKAELQYKNMGPMKEDRYGLLAETYKIFKTENAMGTQLFFIPLPEKQVFETKNAIQELNQSPHNAAIATKLTQCYKIHLMPQEEDIEFTILKIMDTIARIEKLHNIIVRFKLMLPDEQILKNNEFPKIIIYTQSGKNGAQYVLDSMYSLFANYAHKGAGWTPRYNYPVNDFVFFAQGDGGDKKDDSLFLRFFESPLRIYYRHDITGKVEDYHLINPATGKPALQEDMLSQK